MRRLATVVALCVLVLSVAFVVGALTLMWLGGGDTPSQFFGDPLRDGTIAVGLLAYAIVGTLIVARRPDSVVGWLFLLLGLDFSAFIFSGWYASYGLIGRPGSLPGADVVAWLVEWMWTPAVAGFATALLVFPDGRLVTPRWRFALWLVVAAFVVETIGYGLGGNVRYDLPARRPLSIPDAQSVLLGVQLVGDNGLLGPAILIATASLVVRFRRSRGVERQQLKWIAYAAALLTVGLAYTAVLSIAVGPRAGAAASLPWAAGIVTVPVAAGIAILRYRLYEIDLLINRTLVYGALSATLVATYLAVVVLFQAALRPFTAGNELAVAGSTLATLALVQPLRRRIHEAVDRRFYRSRYDAARTLDAFSVRLRDEVDLDEVRADLIGAVGETVRPAHASVWLRAPREAAR